MEGHAEPVNRERRACDIWCRYLAYGVQSLDLENLMRRRHPAAQLYEQERERQHGQEYTNVNALLTATHIIPCRHDYVSISVMIMIGAQQLCVPRLCFHQ